MIRKIIIGLIALVIIFICYKLFKHFTPSSSTSMIQKREAFESPRKKSNLIPIGNDKCLHLLSSDLNYNWYLDGTVLGKGKKGIVYGGIGINDNDEKISVAVKVLDVVGKDKLQQEADKQNYASNLGLAPPIYDALWCDFKGYLIMEKAGTGLADYLKDNFQAGSKEQLNVLKELKKMAEELVVRMMRSNIVHTDLHIDNFMIQMDEYRKPIVTIIDWDAAAYGQFNDLDIEEKLDDLNLTFNLLRKNLLEANNMFTPRYKVPEGPSKRKQVSNRESRTEMKDQSQINTNLQSARNLYSEPAIPRMVSHLPVSNEPEVKNLSDEYEYIQDEYSTPNKTMINDGLPTGNNLFKGETDLNDNLFKKLTFGDYEEDNNEMSMEMQPI